MEEEAVGYSNSGRIDDENASSSEAWIEENVSECDVLIVDAYIIIVLGLVKEEGIAGDGGFLLEFLGTWWP